MKLVRLTRHSASKQQLTEINRLFPGAQVVQVSETLASNSREAVQKFDEIMFDAEVAEVVLPVNLLEAIIKYSQFVKRGGKVIRAITNRELDEDGNVTFTFDHYEQVVKVEVVTVRLSAGDFSKIDDKLLRQMLHNASVNSNGLLYKQVEAELKTRSGFNNTVENGYL